MCAPNFFPISKGATKNPINADKINLTKKYTIQPANDIHKNILGCILFNALHPKKAHTKYATPASPESLIHNAYVIPHITTHEIIVIIVLFIFYPPKIYINCDLRDIKYAISSFEYPEHSCISKIMLLIINLTKLL